MSNPIYITLEHLFITPLESKTDEELKEMNSKEHPNIILFHKPEKNIDAYKLHNSISHSIEEAKQIENITKQYYTAGFFHPAFAQILNQFKAAFISVLIEDNNEIKVNGLFTKSKDSDWIEYPITNSDLTPIGAEIIANTCKLLNESKTESENENSCRLQ